MRALALSRTARCGLSKGRRTLAAPRAVREPLDVLLGAQRLAVLEHSQAGLRELCDAQPGDRRRCDEARTARAA